MKCQLSKEEARGGLEGYVLNEGQKKILVQDFTSEQELANSPHYKGNYSLPARNPSSNEFYYAFKLSNEKKKVIKLTEPFSLFKKFELSIIEPLDKYSVNYEKVVDFALKKVVEYEYKLNKMEKERGEREILIKEIESEIHV